MSDAQPAPEPKPAADVRPYIVKTYDRWIILVIVLVAGWFLFRPIFAFSVYYRGLSFEHMLALKTAEHYYRKAIGVDPRVPEGWLGLGTLQTMHARAQPDQYSAAIDTFTRGLDYSPHNGALAFMLCRTYYEVGRDYKGALGACRRAFANAPENAFAWDYAAWSALHVGQRDLALQYWREALRRGHWPAAGLIKRYSART
jgi:tetratricopeptide (TPR) repeat protein